MYCSKAPRALRNKNVPQQTSDAGDCWGNLSPLSGINARVCGFPHEVILCKKHFDEQSRLDQLKCCFPLVKDSPCKGTLVKCPRRLFPVFDEFLNTPHTGTYICEDHLTLADKDEQVCQKAGYTPPKKVGKLERYM